MSERILLSSPHMSDEGYELEYINDAFKKNWIAPLGSIPGNIIQVGVAGIIVLVFIQQLRKYVKAL